MSESITPQSMTIGQLKELYAASGDADVVRACLVALGDASFVLSRTPSDEECDDALAVCAEAWNARGAKPSSLWRTDAPPRGVRCLVTARQPGGDLGVYAAEFETRRGDDCWTMHGAPMLGVVAWMPAPDPAEAP